MLCFAYKWLGEKGVHVVLGPEKQIIKKLWELFDEADVLCAHNGDRFDIPYAMTRFAYYGLGSPSPSKSIDTLKMARRLRFPSNKLGDLGVFLGLGQKAKHDGFDTWKGVMAGDASKTRKMALYNAQDVRLLERVYLKLRPFCGGILLHLGASCTTCGSDEVQFRGRYITRTKERKRYQCQKCGVWGIL